MFMTGLILVDGGWRDLDILRHRATAIGQITAVRGDFDYDYQFALGEQIYRGQAHISEPQLKDGEGVQVLYSTVDPSHSHLGEPHNPLPLIGTFWILTSVALIIDRMRRLRAANAPSISS